MSAELPEGWRLSLLGDEIELKYGKSLPESQRTPGQFLVFGSSGCVGSHDAALTSGPTIVVGRKGNVGAVWTSDGACWPIDTTYYIDAFGPFDAGFLAPLLTHVGLHVLDRSTAVPGLNRNDAYAAVVPVPPADEQRRIVAKLDALRARSRRAKEALDEVPALLDRLRQSILASAFRGDLTADWRAAHPDVEPASELLKRIRVERRKRWEEAELAKLTAKGKEPKDAKWKSKYVEPEPVDESELPELPEGWCWASVEELCMRVTDGTHLTPAWAEAGVPFLVISNVSGGEVDWNSVTRWISTAEYERVTAHARPTKGDVLYTAVGSFGIAVVVRDDRDFAFQRHIAHLHLPLIDPEILALALNSPSARAYAERVAHGNAQRTVTLTDLRMLPVPLPPLTEHVVLVNLVRALSSRATALTTASVSVAAGCTVLDSAILAAAFRGELL